MSLCQFPKHGRERQASWEGCGGLATLSVQGLDTEAYQEEQGTAGLRQAAPGHLQASVGGREPCLCPVVESCAFSSHHSKHSLEIQIKSGERGCGETESWAKGQGRGRCRLGRKRGVRQG